MDDTGVPGVGVSQESVLKVVGKCILLVRDDRLEFCIEVWPMM